MPVGQITNEQALQAFVRDEMDRRGLNQGLVARLGSYNPHVRVYNSAAITHAASGAFQALTFDSERWDLGTATEQHSTTAATGRLTCRAKGVYMIGGTVQWDADATNIRILGVLLNGTTEIARDRRTAIANLEQTIAIQYRLAEGDYVELQAYQNSGGNRTISAGLVYSPEFYMCWAGT